MVPQSEITLSFNLPFKVEILPKRNSIILFPRVSTITPRGQTWWGNRGRSKGVERVATPTHP